jgi:hypothetical protein
MYCTPGNDHVEGAAYVQTSHRKMAATRRYQVIECTSTLRRDSTQLAKAKAHNGIIAVPHGGASEAAGHGSVNVSLFST